MPNIFSSARLRTSRTLTPTRPDIVRRWAPSPSTSRGLTIAGIITIRAREGIVQGDPDGFADDELTAARGQEVIGRGEYLLGKDPGVSLPCLELQPIPGTREVGDEHAPKSA